MNDEFDLPKVNIGARIPPAWAEELKELAINIGCSQTELITEAIGLYLQKPIDKIVDRVTTLERKLDGFNDNGTLETVDTGISSELFNKVEQVLETNQTVIKENTETNQILIRKNAEINQTIIKENTELKNIIANLNHTIVNLSHQLNNLSDQINNIQQQPPTENLTLVDTGISPELIKKLEQVIEIDQAPIKENTETQPTLIKENTELKNTIANLTNQIANLKNTITNLKNTIANLNHQIDNIKQQPPIERLIEPVSDNKYLGGLTQTELCIRSGINPGSLAGKAKQACMSPQEYLAERTGWEYRVPPGGQRGRWYLPEKPLPTEESMPNNR